MRKVGDMVRAELEPLGFTVRWVDMAERLLCCGGVGSAAPLARRLAKGKVQAFFTQRPSSFAQ